jgi:hypothetical protein
MDIQGTEGVGHADIYRTVHSITTYYFYVSLYRCLFKRPSGTGRVFLIDTGAKAPAYYHRVPPGRLRFPAFGAWRSAPRLTLSSSLPIPLRESSGGH